MHDGFPVVMKLSCFHILFMFLLLLQINFINNNVYEVQPQLSKGTNIRKIQSDLKLSTIKLLHEMWLLYAVEKRCKQTKFIQNSFAKAGI